MLITSLNIMFDKKKIVISISKIDLWEKYKWLYLNRSKTIGIQKPLVCSKNLAPRLHIYGELSLMGGGEPHINIFDQSCLSSTIYAFIFIPNVFFSICNVNVMRGLLINNSLRETTRKIYRTWGAHRPRNYINLISKKHSTNPPKWLDFSGVLYSIYPGIEIILCLPL